MGTEDQNHRRHFIIAGPCSAESREQVLECAKKLAETRRISAFRAGVWKPRTKPGTFEGRGEKALEWLAEAQALTRIPALTEIGCPRHAEAALRAGIKHFWIGGRTTTNPFAAEELAEALRGTDASVFVKNPLVPDVDLWEGTLERFMAAGVAKVGAIHRGFYPTEPSRFRNIPKWEIPLELRRRKPDLRILCDPSHISGNRLYITEVAIRALELSLDGLMVEVHPSPPNALTDACQQITPAEFGAMIAHYLDRKRELAQAGAADDGPLHLARVKIDSIDYQMIDLLTRRFDVIREIAGIKNELGLEPRQKDRWESVFANRMAYAIENGLDTRPLAKLLNFIHDESIALQRVLRINGAKEEGKTPKNEPR